MRAARAVVDNPLFNFVPEVTDQTLNRPGRRVSESADGVSLHLAGDIKKHVDLGGLGFASRHSLENPPHPACPLPAGSALTTAFMFVEISDPGDRLHDVG